MRKSVSLVAAAAAAALGIAGCGVNDPGQVSPPKSDSSLATPQDDFIVTADAICEEYGKRFDAVPLPQGNPAAPNVSNKVLAQAVDTARALAAIEREMATKLRALTPLPEIAEAFDAALGWLQNRVQHFEKLADAAETRDREQVAKEFRAADRAGTRGRKAIAGFGFEICGKP